MPKYDVKAVVEFFVRVEADSPKDASEAVKEKMEELGKVPVELWDWHQEGDPEEVTDD